MANIAGGRQFEAEFIAMTTPTYEIYAIRYAQRDGRRTAHFADSRRHIVPGHDPLVMQRYPVAGPGLERIAVRPHAKPTDSPTPA